MTVAFLPYIDDTRKYAKADGQKHVLGKWGSRQDFAADPSAQPGFLKCGLQPDGRIFAAIDLDNEGKSGDVAGYCELYGLPPEAVRHDTPNFGYHLVLAVPVALRNKQSKKSDGTRDAAGFHVDVRGEGGLLYGPGTNWTDAPRPCAFHGAHGYDDVPSVETWRVVWASQWWDKYSEVPQIFTHEGARVDLGLFLSGDVDPHALNLSNEWLLWYDAMAFLEDLHYPEKAIIEALGHCQGHDPAKTTAQVKHYYGNAHERDKSRLRWRRAGNEIEEEADARETRGVFDCFVGDDLAALELFPPAGIDRDTGEVKYSKRPDTNWHSLVADFLAEHFTFISTGDKIWAWNGSYYDDLTEAKLFPLLEDLCVKKRVAFSQNVFDEVTGILRGRFNIHDTHGTVLNNYPDIIAFSNTWLHVTPAWTVELLDPDPAYYITRAFAHPYTPAAECPTFQTFMEDVIPNEDLRELFLTFLAYSLTPSMKAQKGLLCPGTSAGNNGKSVFCNVISEVFAGRVESVPLQKLSDERWVVTLRGANLNLIRDMPNTKMEEEGAWKNAVTEKKLTGKALYQQPCTFPNTAKTIGFCNDLPLPPDDASDAFWKRAKIVPWLEEFMPEDNPQFDPDIHHKMDPDLEDKLLAEVDGIIAYILGFLPKIPRLLYVFDVEANKRLWRSYSNNVLQFIEECCDIKPTAHVEEAKFREKYKEWAGKHGYRTLTPKSISTAVFSLGINRDRISKHDEDGHFTGQEYVYAGITWK